MITVEEQISELHRRIKKLESTQVRVAAGTLSGANTSTQKGDIALPDGTIVLGAPVAGNYIPETGHQVPVLIAGTAPVIFPPTQPITSSPPAQVTGVVLTPGIGSIMVRWSALTEADVKWNRGYYQVQLDTVNTFNSGNLKSQDSPGTVSTFTELTPATTYYVRVRGVDYVGTTSVGGWSATASVAAGSPAASTITGQITNTQIADNSISTPKLQANSVTANEIAANAITAADMLANTITAGQVAANTLTAAEIAADAITASELAALNLAVGKYIKSTTYVAGSSGWAINADGSAEFGNVTVRGTVDSSRIKASTLTGIAATSLITNPGAETNTTGWAGNNTTLTRTTTAGQFRSGVGAFKLQASAAGDQYMETPTGTSGFPVIPGVTYSATAFFKTAATKRTCKVEMRFFNSGGSFTHAVSSQYEDGTNFWRAIQATSGALPAGDAFCSVRLTILSSAINEVHYIDDVALQPTSTMVSDLYTGTSGSPALAIYSDLIPQIVFYSGIDGEAAGQIYRTTFVASNAIDLTTMTMYSGFPSGGSASFFQLDSSGVSSGKNRLARISADRAYLDYGSGDQPLFNHSTDNQILGGGAMNTNSTLPVEPVTNLRISFVKRTAESYICVTAWANSIYVNTGLGDQIKIWVNDGTNTTLMAVGFSGNGGGLNCSMHGCRHILGGAAAGTYTLQWRWSTTGQTVNFDGNSSIGIKAEEVALP